tara:strand:- start:512 stop:781 length:270 start_codon:yes stop_codon:yes gene_type:complete
VWNKAKEDKIINARPDQKKKRKDLNAYNRKNGTYGNGDKKDASHVGGKIVGFESESKNRGRLGEGGRKKKNNGGFLAKSKLKSMYKNTA